jgi:hypothetical protein
MLVPFLHDITTLAFVLVICSTFVKIHLNFITRRMNGADENALFIEPVFDVLIHYRALYIESSTNFLKHARLNIKNHFILALLRWFPSTKYPLHARHAFLT